MISSSANSASNETQKSLRVAVQPVSIHLYIFGGKKLV